MTFYKYHLIAKNSFRVNPKRKVLLMRNLLMVLLLCISNLSQSQDISVVLKEAERLEAIPNEKEALKYFKEALKIQPLNLHALTKCSELCSRIGAREKVQQTRDSYFQAALIYAKTATKYHPNSDEALVVMGIAMGRMALTKSGKEKIATVKEIKHYAEMALKINPDNFKAWHIIGKWNYEVSSLTVLEKAATKVFYGGLPDASLKKSIEAYEKAKSLSPSFTLNYLELAKAYKKNNQKKNAIPLLRYALTIPNRTEDDERIKKEAAELLKEWE